MYLTNLCYVHVLVNILSYTFIILILQKINMEFIVTHEHILLKFFINI